MQYRQGDCLIIPVSSIPADRTKSATGKTVLALGEVTGHHHRFEAHDRVTAFWKEGAEDHTMAGGTALRGNATHVEYIRVPAAGADLLHEEHSTIHVPAGDYLITRQREFDMMEGVRAVAD